MRARTRDATAAALTQPRAGARAGGRRSSGRLEVSGGGGLDIVIEDPSVSLRRWVALRRGPGGSFASLAALIAKKRDDVATNRWVEHPNRHFRSRDERTRIGEPSIEAVRRPRDLGLAKRWRI